MPAKSKAQQSAAGMALAAKKGKMKVSELKGAAKDMYDSMSKKELEDFAKTKRKGLPKKKKNEALNMKVQESLERYRDHRFFNKLYEQKEVEKPDAESEKEAMAVVKRMRDNFKQFKSDAKIDDPTVLIRNYKKFWEKQENALKALQQKDPRIKMVYDLYESDFVVAYLNADGKFGFEVIKKNLGPDEENPFFITFDPKAAEEYRNFIVEMKNEMKAVKDHYQNTIEKKQKEEEQKKKKEKLDKFLKEKGKGSPKKSPQVEEGSDKNEKVNEAEIPIEDLGNLEDYQISPVREDEYPDLWDYIRRTHNDDFFINWYVVERNGEFVAFIAVDPEGRMRAFDEVPVIQNQNQNRPNRVQYNDNRRRTKDGGIIETVEIDLSEVAPEDIEEIKAKDIGIDAELYTNFYRFTKDDETLYARVEPNGSVEIFRIVNEG